MSEPPRHAWRDEIRARVEVASGMLLLEAMRKADGDGDAGSRAVSLASNAVEGRLPRDAPSPHRESTHAEASKRATSRSRKLAPGAEMRQKQSPPPRNVSRSSIDEDGDSVHTAMRRVARLAGHQPVVGLGELQGGLAAAGEGSEHAGLDGGLPTYRLGRERAKALRTQAKLDAINRARVGHHTAPKRHSSQSAM